jgi:hypothetical protein
MDVCEREDGGMCETPPTMVHKGCVCVELEGEEGAHNVSPLWEDQHQTPFLSSNIR